MQPRTSVGTVLLDGSYIEIIASLSFWDLNLVSELLSDCVAKNLMYLEAVAEVTGRWGGELTSLQMKGQKKEVSEAGMRK